MKKTLVNRILTTGLTLTFLAAGLSGCGSNASDGNADTSAPAETVENADTDAAADTAAENSDVQVTTIYAATSGSTNPYTTIDENDEVTGYDCEILKEVFNRLPQYDLEFVVTDFSSIFSGVTSGTYQIACNNFSYSEERAQSYLYSYPYDKISYVFISRDGSITSFADAAGLTFEGQSGVSVTTAIEKWNEDHPDQTININYTEADTPVTMQHIEDGSADFGIIDLAMYVAYQEQYAYDVQKVDLSEEDSLAIAENNYAYYLYSYDNEELRDEVNAVLKELKEDGTISRISEEWFGQDTAPEAEQYESTIN